MFRRSRRVSDLRVAFDLFLATMPPDAPIRAVITSDAIEKELAAFDEADRIALMRQRPNQRANGVAFFFGCVGAILWAILLLPIEAWLPEVSLHALGALRMACLTVAFLSLGWIRWGGSAKWKEARSAAEEIRGQILRHVIERCAHDKVLLAQALACFKIAHLDWQLGFFKKRIAELNEAERRSKAAPYIWSARALSIAGLVLGLIAVVNIAEAFGYSVPYLSGSPHIPNAHRWEAGLSALASSILAFVGARASSLVAALYALVAADLDKMNSEQLPKAEAAAAEGNAKEVLQFVKQVQAVMEFEHRVWRIVG
jgi:hypothetical protein